MATKKRTRKEEFHALKAGSIDGVKRIERSYDELMKYFDPTVRLPLRGVFDTYQDAYNWLYDITPPPSKSRSLF